MNTTKKALFVLSAVLFLGASALAYILPPGQVLSFMMGRFKELRSLSAEGVVEVEPSSSGERVAFPMRLYAEGAGKFRLEIQTRSGTRITVVEDGRGATLVDGKLLSEPAGLKTAFTSIFFHRSLKSAMDSLEGLGVDLMSISLGRFQGSPSYVIGSRSPGEPRPTLWVQKDSFRPVRVVFSHTAGGVDEEMSYLDYVSLKEGVSLPTVVETRKQGSLVRRILIKRYDLNPSLSSDLFSLKSLKRLGGSG